MYLLIKLHEILLLLIFCVALSRTNVIFGVYNISKVTQWNYGFPLDFFYISGMKKCFIECQKNPECQSSVYSPNNDGCQTNRLAVLPATIQDLSDNVVSEFFYIGMVEKTVSTIGQSCAFNSDCLDINSECRDSLCKCHPGYAHNSSIYSCVTSCATYGNTFQEELDQVISGYNDETIGQTSKTNCETACLQATTFVCRSYEFDSSFNTCYLHSVTAATVPSVTDPNYILYTRDCAT